MRAKTPKLMLLPGLATMAVGISLMIGDKAHAALDPVYAEECGSCHVPYPPRALGASSWRLLISDLSHHFGTDASLEEPLRTAVTRYLIDQAKRKETLDEGGRTARRITESLWFKREHDEVSPATWQAAKSKSNCEACHRTAAQGNFSEHQIRLPQ